MNQCLQCQKESVPLVCGKCLSRIERVQNSATGPFSYGRYEGVLKNLIHLFKYENKFALASPLAKLLLEVAPQNGDVIIPVPLHLKKLRERKYNQSVLLGQELSKVMPLPVYGNVLKKTMPTTSQTELSQLGRQKNVLNTFSVAHADRIQGKHVLLLDDVYTTGATGAECEKILLQAGAQKVSIVTLARS
ncbi:MAG: ComF family protein [Deltaproteobacteria bacterium]|nr:ComF family protein [Deltaproteobacteria bacterium]